MQHNHIYEQLTADPDDLVGALAYIVYKQQKVEFCKKTAGGNPSRAEIEQFHAYASMATSLAAYRSQAEAMAQSFLNAGLDTLARRTELETRKDALYIYLRTINADLHAQLESIKTSLAMKRSLLGWMRDIGANLLVNIVTILVIGAIVIGYKSVGQLQHHAETTLGMQQAEAPPRPTPRTPTSGQ